MNQPNAAQSVETLVRSTQRLIELLPQFETATNRLAKLNAAQVRDAGAIKEAQGELHSVLSEIGGLRTDLPDVLKRVGTGLHEVQAGLALAAAVKQIIR